MAEHPFLTQLLRGGVREKKEKGNVDTEGGLAHLQGKTRLHLLEVVSETRNK